MRLVRAHRRTAAEVFPRRNNISVAALIQLSLSLSTIPFSLFFFSLLAFSSNIQSLFNLIFLCPSPQACHGHVSGTLLDSWPVQSDPGRPYMHYLNTPSNHKSPMKSSASATRSTRASQKNKHARNQAKKPSPAPTPPACPKAPADDLRAPAATPQRPSAARTRKSSRQILLSATMIHRLDRGPRSRSLRRGAMALRMRMSGRNRRLQ